MKCSRCTRTFANLQRLRQHERDSHATKAAANGATTSRRGGNGRGRGRGASRGARNAVQDVPVAIGMQVRQAQQDRAEMRGVDRLFHVPDVSQVGAGIRLLDIEIEPGAFKRLKIVARAFQRIKYHRLVFRIEPQVNTLTSGGYVAAFVADPDDLVNDLDSLTAQSGSVTSQWFAPSVITVGSRSLNRLCYTSHGVEVRETSPGRFVMFVDGAATQKGSLTVFVEWVVTLSHPSLEMPAELVKNYFAATNLTTVSGEIGVLGKIGGTQTGDHKLLIPGSEPGDVFQLPFPVAYTDSAAVMRNIGYLVVTKDGADIKLARESPTDVDDVADRDSVLVAFGGTQLKKYEEPEKQGNASVLSSRCRTSNLRTCNARRSESPQGSTELSTCCGSASTASMRQSRTVLPSEEILLLRELVKLMECQLKSPSTACTQRLAEEHPDSENPDSDFADI